MRIALTTLLFCVGIASAQPRGGQAPLLQSVRLITADNRALPGQAALNAALNSHLGRPADEAELGRLADIVVEHLRQRHWPVSLVTVWDEDGGLARGDVTLQVQQGHIGKIGVIGGSKRRQLAVARQLSDLPDKPLDGLALQRRMDALSFSPWLAVTVKASPGDALANADLMFNLRDQNPLQVFASYANNGVEPLGENRYSLGLEWLDAFFLGQDLTLTYTIGNDPHTFSEYAASWRIPLPWGHELRLSGYYDNTHSTASVLDMPLDAGGFTWEASARYVIPWRVSDHLRSEWWIGFDYKQFNTDLTFGGTGVLNGTTGVGELVIGNQWFYDAAQNHARLGIEAAHSGTGWASGQNETEFNQLVPGASPSFTVLRADGAYEYDFRNDVQASLRFGGQWADDLLLPSEELALASMNTVRGYPERSVLASRGAWGSFEARSPAWHLLRAVAFTDGGFGADPHEGTKSISSAGAGIRGDITSHFQFRCEVAFPFTDHLGPRLDVAAVLKF